MDDWLRVESYLWGKEGNETEKWVSESKVSVEVMALLIQLGRRDWDPISIADGHLFLFLSLSVCVWVWVLSVYKKNFSLFKEPQQLVGCLARQKPPNGV